MSENKTLTIRDLAGNRGDYSLRIPQTMSWWKLSSFLEFLSVDPETATERGFLASPTDAFHLEALRYLIEHPAGTLNEGLVFQQQGSVLEGDALIDLSDANPVLELTREPGVFRMSASRLDLAAKNRVSFDHCRNAAITLLDDLIDFTGIVDRSGCAVKSFADFCDSFNEALDSKNQLLFMIRLASVVHAFPFENLSKIFAGVEFRNGLEMIENMSLGFGGICAEKNGVIRFVCDVLGLKTHAVAASTEMLEAHHVDRLREYVEARGDMPMPLWVQHLIFTVELESGEYLIDATNGNLPLLFLDESDSAKMLKGGMRARMVYGVERLNFLPIPTDLGDALMIINEYHVPDQFFEFIFEQGLGLSITPTSYIGVYFDWGGERSRLRQNYYASRARRLRLPYPRFIHDQNLTSIPDDNLRTLLEKALLALRLKYRNRDYSGDFTFVLQPLTGERWSMPRISASVRNAIDKGSI